MARHPPSPWRCYVDNTYTIMKKAHAQKLTEYLKMVDPDIKWVMEGEVETVVTEDADEIVWDRVERALAFLDTFLDTWSVILQDGSIKTNLFRKETHTNLYLNFSSNHPLEHKRGEVHTLLHCAETIVSEPKDREEEKAHIKQALCWNCYLSRLLEGTDMPPPDQPVEEGVEENPPDQH